MDGELFTRSSGNPILDRAHFSYKREISQVLNPAAIKCNRKVCLLVRVIDRRNFSHLNLVRSNDGETGWTPDKKPTLQADINFSEYKAGLEDPRIVWVEELRQYIIACVSFRGDQQNYPNGISLIGTKDFRSFERISKPLGSENKNASLFPRRIKRKFALIHRPVMDGTAHIAVSFSDDLKLWEGNQIILSARQRQWDSEKVGLGCPPIETKEGWILIYHGSCSQANKLIYRVGLALLDLDTLEVKRRSEKWVFGPEQEYEGGYSGIVFPCGHILQNRKLNIYYGAEDSKIGLATANLDEILEYLLKRCPNN